MTFCPGCPIARWRHPFPYDSVLGRYVRGEISEDELWERVKEKARLINLPNELRSRVPVPAGRAPTVNGSVRRDAALMRSHRWRAVAARRTM